jgi:tRNA (guanine6-N2)-methyltransferase
MAKDLTRYYAQTMPGIEKIAWLEIRARLAKVKFAEYVFAQEQNGIVAFDHGGAVADLLGLRTTEDVFIQALSVPKVSRDWQDLRMIAERVQKSAEFGRAMDALRRYRQFRRPPTYRVISRKYGQHQYRRKDFEQAVVKGLKTRYPHWKLVTDRAQLEIWANLLGSRLLIGLRLSDRTMRHRYKKAVELKASLRPSVAAAMVHLTEPEAGDIFCDPMCGSGTLVQERQMAGAYGHILGGDIVAERVDATWRNLAAHRKDIHHKAITVFRWDSRYLPLANETIDKGAANLPFGRQIGNKNELGRLYLAFFGELERVLRPGGRFAVLSSEYDLVKESVRKWARLEILTGYSVAILGQWGRIYLVERRG